MKESNNVHRAVPAGVTLDNMDRKILRYLAEDATRSYVALGALVHLSAPAVHERVKRLKRDGFITGIVATLDGAKIGCPLLAFIQVDTDGRGRARPVLALREMADVEEIHTVAGDSHLMLKVRMRDTEDLDGLLERIDGIDGVRRTRTYIALRTYLERGPKPEIS